jgi:hypothetical protein
MRPASAAFEASVGDELRARGEARDRRDEDDGRSVVQSGSASRQQRTGPRRFAASVASHASVVTPASRSRPDADADVEHHAVEPAEVSMRLRHHARDVGLVRDVGDDRARFAAVAANAVDGGCRARRVAVGDGDPRAFAREEQAHCAPVADRIGRGVERLLAAADDEDAPPAEPAASRRFAAGLGARRSYVARRFGHAFA